MPGYRPMGPVRLIQRNGPAAPSLPSLGSVAGPVPPTLPYQPELPEQELPARIAELEEECSVH